MSVKIGINGFGRIGRNIFRALHERKDLNDIDIVAINDLGDASTNAHLLKFDTAHGKFSKNVECDEKNLVVDGKKIHAFSERNPENIPWKDANVDIVLECTGIFTSKSQCTKHIEGGAKKVIISAPGKSDVDATIVYGVNHQTLDSSHKVISNASCTTNCLAPIAKVLNDEIGIESGIMTTVHSYTNDQVLTDVYHSDLRRARSATQSMIPTKTGAAAAVGLVLPELQGLLDGFAIRVPTINVSFVDFTFSTKRKTSLNEINETIKLASDTNLKGVLGYNELPLVSIDFNHTVHSSIFDSTLTKVINGNQVKVCSWYDNEWGFSNRMLDVAHYFSSI
ncbi:MAG: type I glyceraldehyde-3-phosphate dehydrogenase [Hydrogenophilales bacterium]